MEIETRLITKTVVFLRRRLKRKLMGISHNNRRCTIASIKSSPILWAKSHSCVGRLTGWFSRQRIWACSSAHDSAWPRPNPFSQDVISCHFVPEHHVESFPLQVNHGDSPHDPQLLLGFTFNAYGMLYNVLMHM